MIISNVEWQKTFFLLSFVHIVKRSIAINSREEELKRMPRNEKHEEFSIFCAHLVQQTEEKRNSFDTASDCAPECDG